MSSNVVQAVKEREARKRPVPMAEPEPKPKKAKAKKVEPETVTEADPVEAVVEGPEPIEAYTG